MPLKLLGMREWHLSRMRHSESVGEYSCVLYQVKKDALPMTPPAEAPFSMITLTILKKLVWW